MKCSRCGCVPTARCPLAPGEDCPRDGENELDLLLRKIADYSRRGLDTTPLHMDRHVLLDAGLRPTIEPFCYDCGGKVDHHGQRCQDCRALDEGGDRKAEDYSAEDTVALLQADVNALWRVVKECCELLGVTEDDENDWPKLPTYVQSLLNREYDSEIVHRTDVGMGGAPVGKPEVKQAFLEARARVKPQLDALREAENSAAVMDVVLGGEEPKKASGFAQVHCKDCKHHEIRKGTWGPEDWCGDGNIRLESTTIYCLDYEEAW